MREEEGRTREERGERGGVKLLERPCGQRKVAARSCWLGGLATSTLLRTHGESRGYACA